MKPLTIKELWALPNRDWVWLTNTKLDISTYAQIEDTFNFRTCKADRRLYSREGICYINDNYGEDWLAWKNKEQAESQGEQ